MNGVVLHDLTDQQLRSFIKRPAQAVLLVGPAGSGKLALAKQLAENVLDLAAGKFDDHPYTAHIASIEGKAIGIDQARQLEKFLGLKVPTNKPYNRAVLIEDGQLLTIEAQNALLKTLEEPPQDTIIILTARNEQALLPTIRSRVQTVRVKQPAQSQLTEHFARKGMAKSNVQQAYRISGGLPGLMTALLEDSEHPLLAATERARALLGQSPYERLLSVDELSKNKALALDTLFILGQMAHVSLQSASAQPASRWRKVMESSYRAADMLTNSAQPKLALTKLMLDL